MSRAWRRTAAGVAALAIACGCHRERATRDREAQAAPDRESISALHASPAEARHVAIRVLITARQCLSCRDIGFGLRRLARVARTSGRQLQLEVPRGDESAVAEFLRREHLADDVQLVGRASLAGVGDNFIVLFPEDGRVDSLTAPDGASLVRLLEARSEPGK